MDKRKLKLIFADALLLGIIYVFSLYFGTSDSMRIPEYITAKQIIIFFLFSQTTVLLLRYCWRIYNYLWRYAEAQTYIKLILSDFMAFVIIFFFRFLSPYLNMGFGVTGLMIALNCLAALSMRFVHQLFHSRSNLSGMTKDEQNNRINIAIVGAGNIGASLASELLRNPEAHYNPLCFIDVDRYKIGQKINDLPVFAENEKIVDRIKRMPVQEIVIAMPDADGEKSERLYNLYRQTGCKVKIYGYPLGADTPEEGSRSLRELSIEDLLARESISFDNSLSAEYYRGKTVLITGGGGSIGSELCRQIAKFNPERLIIFDIYENNAYDIQQELRRKYGDSLKLEVLIGSVRDEKRLEQVFSELRPQIVLHAAAHKHVPLMEKSSAEAIKNNVFGTYSTANMSEKYGAEKFVLISTDKAVNPTNIMGASKRLCEMVIQSRKDSATKFVAVRFGNVLGSNGSVIPLFRKQIEEGGPITITDKRIIRYFMTIPEASQLVLQAGAMARRGELFVLDMGKPVKIYDLAVNMIRLSGLTPGKDIEITEVGLRPGEKLYEELLIESESLSKTENELIFVEKDKAPDREEMEKNIEFLRTVIEKQSNASVLAAVKQLVPTYLDANEVNSRPITNSMLKKQI